MTEEELRRIWKNRWADLKIRPDHCTVDEWKNRFRISAKPSQENYLSAFIYFKKMGWSWSSGINNLIASNPEIQQIIQNELQNDP